MKYFKIAALCLIALLFFVWPIPHTITIRQTAIFLSLPLLGYLAYCSYRKGSTLRSLNGLKVPAVLLAAITLWMLIVAVFISEETAWSLDEIRSVWGMSVLSLIIGGLTAFSCGMTGAFSRKNVLIILFVVLLVHIFYIDLYYFYNLATGDNLHWRMGGLTYSDKATYLSNLLFAILCSEAIIRITYRERFLPCNTPLLVFFFLATIFSVYIEAYRFGTISMLFILIVAVFLYVLEIRVLSKKTAVLGFLCFAFLISAGIFTLKSDPRWGTLLETIPLALDTENYRAWLDPGKYPYPKLKSGRQVNISNYERVAWFKEGLLLVRDNPLGIGFGRSAFKVGLQKKYGEGMGHSHSGFIDMATGTGVPGALLWLFLLGSLIYVSFKVFKRGRNFAALLLILVVSKFSFRMMVDSIIRDHMLQEFMFVVGVLSVMMLLDEEKGGNQGATGIKDPSI